MARYKDLDNVRLLVDVTTDGGSAVSTGTEGTIVGVWGDGMAYIVEFSEPIEGLAEVLDDQIELVSMALLQPKAKK